MLRTGTSCFLYIRRYPSRCCSPPVRQCHRDDVTWGAVLPSFRPGAMRARLQLEAHGRRALCNDHRASHPLAHLPTERGEARSPDAAEKIDVSLKMSRRRPGWVPRPPRHTYRAATHGGRSRSAKRSRLGPPHGQPRLPAQVQRVDGDDAGRPGTQWLDRLGSDERAGRWTHRYHIGPPTAGAHDTFDRAPTKRLPWRRDGTRSLSAASREVEVGTIEPLLLQNSGKKSTVIRSPASGPICRRCFHAPGKTPSRGGLPRPGEADVHMLRHAPEGAVFSGLFSPPL